MQSMGASFLGAASATVVAALSFVLMTSVSSAGAQGPRFYVALEPGAGLTPSQLLSVDADLSQALAAERSVVLHPAGASAATASATIAARGLLGRQVTWTAAPSQTVNGTFALTVEIVCRPYPLASSAPPTRFTVTLSLPGARTLAELVPALGNVLSDTIARLLR